MSLENMNIKDYIKFREFEKWLYKREKERKAQKRSNKKMRLFFIALIALFLLFMGMGSYGYFRKWQGTQRTFAVVNGIRRQSTALPMDGAVGSFLIEYTFEVKGEEIKGSDEIDFKDFYYYFTSFPKAGENILILYAIKDPYVNEIIPKFEVP